MIPIKTFVPTIEPREYDAVNDITYLDNSYGDSMCKKYNRAIDMIGDYQGWVCFRHDDLEIRTPADIVQARLRQAYDKNQVIAGVIGTFNLDYLMHWWYPDREVNGCGYILQKVLDENKKPVVPEKTYEMKEWPGFHDGVATVDGCVMWIHTDAFKHIRFDEKIKGYHFYDVDICLQALRAHLGVCTVPIVACHESAGDFDKKEMDKLRVYVFDKWSRIANTFPINKYSMFRRDDEIEIPGISDGESEQPSTEPAERERKPDSAKGQLQKGLSVFGL